MHYARPFLTYYILADYDCFCKPCVRAFDVDVYEHIEGMVDHHLQEY